MNPPQDNPQNQPPKSDADQGGSSDQAPTRSFHVVIVDDNYSASYLLGRLLEKLGQRVEVVNTAMEAFELVCSGRPDMLISDIEMPEVSGYELAVKVREQLKDEAPFLVALTGFGQEKDREESFRHGFERHLTKPIGVAQLRDLIERLTQKAAVSG